MNLKSYTRGLQITSKKSDRDQTVMGANLKPVGYCRKGTFRAPLDPNMELLHIFRRFIALGRSVDSRMKLMDAIRVERAAGIN